MCMLVEVAWFLSNWINFNKRYLLFCDNFLKSTEFIQYFEALVSTFFSFFGFLFFENCVLEIELDEVEPWGSTVLWIFFKTPYLWMYLEGKFHLPGSMGKIVNKNFTWWIWLSVFSSRPYFLHFHLFAVVSSFRIQLFIHYVLHFLFLFYSRDKWSSSNLILIIF